MNGRILKQDTLPNLLPLHLIVSMSVDVKADENHVSGFTKLFCIDEAVRP